jgi:hypothetical protein
MPWRAIDRYAAASAFAMVAHRGHSASGSRETDRRGGRGVGLAVITRWNKVPFSEPVLMAERFAERTLHTVAVALTRYEIQQPNKPSFTTDVAEAFSVKGDKLDSLGIYFDTAPYK